MNTPPPKPKSAAALAYQTGATAPKVVAKGRGLVAEQIIARAKENGVFVHESKELVALLMQVELDKHIPPALYRAVAELLAWLYYIETAKKNGSVPPPAPETIIDQAPVVTP
ncbi:MAG: EscU/YscU/HrcU family type III secretion system export apparatus switch protein [Burkholderiales bacterium]|nr:EscU/YscU/HrcU family type III secretion system export apparatus switch protein [Burkholderiales bacterium]